ncbi:MAG: tryptophan--tRNA ligase, partial [Pseudomonadota bacterium]
SRDIAIKFNNDFNAPDFFPVPEPMIEGSATRVMSLRDGSKKMSKSDASDMSRINLTDDADTIVKKFKKAKTDPEPLPDSLERLEDRPEARNLVNIYAALAETTPELALLQFAGAQFGTFKPALADLAVDKLAPISARMAELMADKGEIDRILGDGADRAAAIAEPILDKTYEYVGFLASRS